MALLPYLLEDSFPSRLLEQQFGLALTPDDLLMTPGRGGLLPASLQRDYYRPWRHLTAAARDVGSTIKADKDKFQVTLDVQHFKPEEISVKTADGYVVISGKHEERQDEHGYVTRQFSRRYALPEGCEPANVQSRLSSDGVLTVLAPRHNPQMGAGERAVPIAHTGPVRKEQAQQEPAAVTNDTQPSKKGKSGK